MLSKKAYEDQRQERGNKVWDLIQDMWVTLCFHADKLPCGWLVGCSCQQHKCKGAIGAS